MAIFKLYSKRQKELRGEIPEVFSYDAIPQALKVQASLIIEDAFGTDIGRYDNEDKPEKAISMIHEAICREYGVFELGINNTGYSRTGREQLKDQLLYSKETDKVLDVIEFCFKYITLIIAKDLYNYEQTTTIKLTPDEAVEELNIRFREHGVGYQFESNEIIRIDSTYVHSEITKPVLTLLWRDKFKGANEEYLKAHEHYRHGRNKECLADCLKAFESTIKTICNEKGWTYNPTDTASKLINVCFANNLIPSYTQNQFSSLQNLLTTGIPTIRNKVGGHGQGQVPQKVDDELTRYGLNLTGTNIIFLIEQSGL